MLAIFIGGFLALGLFGLVFIYFYRESTAYKKQIERSLKMVPLLIRVPRDMGSKNNQSQSRDDRELAKEIISMMESFYTNLSVIYQKGAKNILRNFLHGQRHIALEIVSKDREIMFYLAVPIILVDLVEKSLSSQYPESVIEEAEEHNIFSEEWKNSGIYGGELRLKKPYIFPIKTYRNIDSEPLEAIVNSLSKMEEGEGAAIQILIRPVSSRKAASGRDYVQAKQAGPKSGIVGEAMNSVLNPEATNVPKEPVKLTAMEEEVNKAVEEKAGKPFFETTIRLIVSTQNVNRSEMVVREMEGAFGQFNDQNLNYFKFHRAKNPEALVTDYICRFFEHRILSRRDLLPNIFGHKNILNSEELASIFHLPNFLVTSPGIKWLNSKRSESPAELSSEGTILGRTKFRNEEKQIRLADNDLRRHVYILGQTGTGKSNLLKNMILEDIRQGKGVAYVDPHGEAIEDIIARIPRERAEDVIIFDAGDMERPMGLNLFEAKSVDQQDFVIQEAIQMLYRLYDPGHTGIMGPRFEHWFRNAALALMADPSGGTFIEVPKIFTDDKFMAEKLKYVTDPVVRNFWINEMGQTSDFHKSEMLGWFVGKFGAFMTNTTMRNILGQVQSSLNIREAMDSGKILLVNLSKGKIGEINMQLLGMIFVSKIQMAAMSRADVPEDQRRDFILYVDEFQNFATDSFAQILSEARKYRLSLVVANQFIGQLKDEIKLAVFGNAGTIISFRVGPEDGEFMAKQFEPVFNVNDLINIENYHAFIRLMVGGVPSRPFTFNPYPASSVADPKLGDAIKQLARLKYSRPRSIVEKEVLSRMKIDAAPATDPTLTSGTMGL